MALRLCKAVKEGGGQCQAPPLQDGDYCLMHSPEHSEEVAEARRLGGLRRRKERTVAGIYDFEGLGATRELRRLLQIAVVDTLALENSVARSRTLAYLVQVGVNLLEKGEMEERLKALEETVKAGSRGMRGG